MIQAIIQAIAKQVVQGLGSTLQTVQAREQGRAADRLASMTDKLGMVELAMERQRQTAARQAMSETLREIDEAYGQVDTPRGRMNQSIIRGMIAQLGRAATRPAAEASVAAGASEARGARREAAARGVGGSTVESAARAVTDLAAQRRTAVSGRREATEYETKHGLDRQRREAQGRAISLADAGKANARSIYDQVASAIMGESAMRQERTRHVPAIAASASEGIGKVFGSIFQGKEEAEKKEEDELLKKALSEMMAKQNITEGANRTGFTLTF